MSKLEMRKVQVHFAPADWERLEAKADKMRMPMAAVVRSIVGQALDREYLEAAKAKGSTVAK